jgi:hypothetical protein
MQISVRYARHNQRIYVDSLLELLDQSLGAAFSQR